MQSGEQIQWLRLMRRVNKSHNKRHNKSPGIGTPTRVSLVVALLGTFASRSKLRFKGPVVITSQRYLILLKYGPRFQRRYCYRWLTLCCKRIEESTDARSPVLTSLLDRGKHWESLPRSCACRCTLTIYSLDAFRAWHAACLEGSETKKGTYKW